MALDDPQPAGARGAPADSTVELLSLAKGGDAAALDRLFARYLIPLQRWAHRRLPPWARLATDTHDLVQDTLLNAFKQIERFEPRHEGAFLAYLRQAMMNRIRDQIRRSAVRPAADTFDETAHRPGLSELEQAAQLDKIERYEAALAKLNDPDREAIIGRVELGYTYEELAASLGKPSPDAARMAVTRALVRFAEEMKRGTAR